MLLSSCLLPAKDAVGEGGAAEGGASRITTGGGLCSPGRWAHHARSYAHGSSWDWLRDRMLKLIIAKVGSEEQLEKEAFRMAAGGEQGCSLASDLELQSQLKEWLEAQDLSEPGLLEVASLQPLHLRLLRAMLSSSGRRRMGYPWASWIRYRGLPTSSRNS